MSSPLPTSQPTAPATLSNRLRRIPRRALLVIGLLPMLVWLWLPLLSGKQPPAPAPVAPVDAVAPVASPEPAQLAAAPAGEIAAATPPGSEAAIARLTTRVQALLQPYQPRWNPNELRVAAEVPRAAPTDTAEAADPRLVPTLIVTSLAQAAVAIVHGRAYRVGDEVDGRKVIEIAERHIVYREGERTFAVDFPRPALRVPR